MLMTIPPDKYHGVKIGNIRVTGYKSLRMPILNEKFELISDDDEGASLSISTEGFQGCSFKCTFDNRTALLQLKEALDFALAKEDDDNVKKKEVEDGSGTSNGSPSLD